mmetsp:Transcript_18628/g.41889  ORF Transcript_18628/g.41889 Transcript_18628/m.41889 type:complete len:269 (-) Transcript_18628:151-957(-)
MRHIHGFGLDEGPHGCLRHRYLGGYDHHWPLLFRRHRAGLLQNAPDPMRSGRSAILRARRFRLLHPWCGQRVEAHVYQSQRVGGQNFPGRHGRLGMHRLRHRLRRHPGLQHSGRNLLAQHLHGRRSCMGRDNLHVDLRGWCHHLCDLVGHGLPPARGSRCLQRRRRQESIGFARARHFCCFGQRGSKGVRRCPGGSRWRPRRGREAEGGEAPAGGQEGGAAQGGGGAAASGRGERPLAVGELPFLGGLQRRQRAEEDHRLGRLDATGL